MIRIQIDKVIKATDENENDRIVYFSFFRPDENEAGWFTIAVHEITKDGRKPIYKKKISADKISDHIHNFIPSSNIGHVMEKALEYFCEKDMKSSALCKHKRNIVPSSYAHLINLRKIDEENDEMQIFTVTSRHGETDLIPSVRLSHADNAHEALSKTFGCNIDNINTVAVLRNTDKGHTNYLCVLNDEELAANGCWKDMSKMNPNKLGEVLLEAFCSSGDENCCGEKVVLANISSQDE